MAQKDFTIQNKLGIHARPAAQFVKMANRFKSDISVEKDGEGEDETAALEAIGDLIDRKFEEE